MIRRRRDPSLESIVEQFDSLRMDYDAAKRSRFKRSRTGMVPTGSGADYHYRTEAGYFGMMETARDLFRNHCLIGQGIRRLGANILRGGFVLDVKTGDEAVDADLGARWKAYAEDPAQVDLAGEQDFHGLEKLALQHVLVDGDVLSLLTIEGAIQQVEAHRLRTPQSTTRDVVHGILLDEYRRRLEYWITRDDIGLGLQVPNVKDVIRYPVRDAAGNRQVLHHYMPDRISQTRGITCFAPAVDTAGMGDDLMFAQLVKAQMAACLTILRELSEGALPGVSGQGMAETSETRPDGTTRILAGWQPGMEIFGWPGEKLSGFSPSIPNQGFFEHAMFILTIVAVNLDLPLAILLLDPSKTNFSGWRGAMDQARQRFSEIQKWFSGSFHRPVYTWKVRQWMAADPALARAATRPGIDIFGHRWQAAGWPYIQPEVEAAADAIQEANLFSSRRRLAANRGMDYDDLVREIVEDRTQIIVQAHKAAESLNAKYGLELTWRDIAQWPLPQGMQIAVNPAAGLAPDDSPGANSASNPETPPND